MFLNRERSFKDSIQLREYPLRF